MLLDSGCRSILPIILRYQQHMAQAGSLGLVGDGRSLAEGCVPSPAMSALSLPWFRGAYLQAFRHHIISKACNGMADLR